MSDHTEWLTPIKAAEILGVRPDALPRMVRAGRIPKPSYTLGPRSPRYDREALDKTMRGGLASTNPDEALELYREKEAQRARRAA